MRMLTMIVGALLLLLACYGYFGAQIDQRSLTALIPAIVGVPLLVCGLLAWRPQWRATATHVAVAFAALGALAAGGRGLPKVTVLFSDDPDANRRAIIIVLLMFVLCAGYLLLAVRSFLVARRKRLSETVT